MGRKWIFQMLFAEFTKILPCCNRRFARMLVPFDNLAVGATSLTSHCSKRFVSGHDFSRAVNDWKMSG